MILTTQLPCKTFTICLANHTGSISYHIISLVLIALGAGKHTQTHTHTDILDKSNYNKPVQLARSHTPGLISVILSAGNKGILSKFQESNCKEQGHC